MKENTVCVHVYVHVWNLYGFNEMFLLSLNFWKCLCIQVVYFFVNNKDTALFFERWRWHIVCIFWDLQVR